MLNIRSLFRPKFACAVSLALFAGMNALPASAADWFVRPDGGSYGSGTGRDWSNAFAGLGGISWSSVACGDTIWVAGGNYTRDLAPAKKCSASSRLSIRRARTDAAAATSAAGWSSSFASTVHQISGAGIVFNGDWDYITISGRTTAGGGDRGWWIDMTGRTSGAGIEFVNGAGADYNTMEYMDVQGPGAINYTGDGRGIDATPFSTATGNTFSRMRIFDWESAIYNAGINASVFEYLDVYDIHAQNWSSYHPNGLYTSGAKGGIVRYSTFRKGPKGHGVGEGIFFEQAGGSTDWQIYGNVFSNLDQSGLKAIQMTSNVGNIKIFNNTFNNIIVPGVYVNQGSCGSGAEVRNNLFVKTSGPSSCGSASNNLVSSSTGVFADSAFRIVSTVGSGYPRNAGQDLSSLFRSDMTGMGFGTDGAWDIGAFEYSTGTAAAVPSPPTDVRVQ
jgi:hypothetical protein